MKILGAFLAKKLAVQLTFMPKFKLRFAWLRRIWQSYRDSRRQPIYYRELSFSAAVNAFPSTNELYAYIHHYYHQLALPCLRLHRQYFLKNQRGFGEDAFHAMWWLLLREFKPKKCLEIGVYRGQVISLWALIGELLAQPISVHGISPFQPWGDAVSAYRDDVDYWQDTLESFRFFHLPPPVLVRALSSEPAAVAHIAQGGWDLVYIDGSHDFEVALADYQLCYQHLQSGGLLVLDDASADTEYHPRRYSFAGHPGPSRVAKEYASKEMEFLGAVGHNNVFRKR
jgi:predicted O-methyltransferase YrrM